MVLTKCATLGRATDASVNPGTFLFGFLFFLVIFLHTFQEAILALRVLNTLNIYVNSLDKNLALALTSEAQLVGRHSAKQKVAGSIPGQNTCIGCRFSRWLRCT